MTWLRYSLIVAVASCRRDHQGSFIKDFDNDWETLREQGHLAVQQELERSLEPFSVNLRPNSSDVEDMVALLLSLPRYAVLVLNNRLFVSSTFLHQGEKFIDHSIFARTALNMKPVPDMIYQFEGGASGPASRFQCSTAIDDGNPHKKAKLDQEYKKRFGTIIPRLSIAKREGYQACAPLVPNPYFKNITNFNSFCSKLEKSSIQHPFGERDHRLFWRGHIRGRDREYPNYCPREGGNYARLLAASLTSKTPEFFDIRCVECEPRNDVVNPCLSYPFDTDMNWTLHHLDSIKGKYTETPDFTNYKHLLNLPGSTSGSYSRNLNTLWILGGIVFLWQNQHVEWYYPALVNGVTHVTVNKSNALDMLQLVMRDSSLTERLIQGSRFIHETYLCPDCLASYFKGLLLTLRRKYFFSVLFDDPERRTIFFIERLNCTQLQLIEILYEKSRKIFVNDLSALSCSEFLDFAMGRPYVDEHGKGPVVKENIEFISR